MATFGFSPFFLDVGDNIFVKGKAQSQIGWGTYSTPQSIMTFRSGPPSVPAPLITEQTDTSITLDWGSNLRTAHDHSSTYDLEWSADGFAWVGLEYGTYATSYTKSGLRNGTSYSFRVRANDLCGASTWSAGTRVNVISNSRPGMVTGVSTYTVDCTTVVTWAAPLTGATSISAYVVEVRSQDGTFYAQDGLCR
jgi:hypothetical protein